MIDLQKELDVRIAVFRDRMATVEQISKDETAKMIVESARVLFDEIIKLQKRHTGTLSIRLLEKDRYYAITQDGDSHYFKSYVSKIDKKDIPLDATIVYFGH